MDFSASEVASWMVKELERDGSLYQDQAVYEIERRFGGEFVYVNDSGNLAIEREVLQEFRTMTEASTIWERGERMWRSRVPSDEPGRMQD